MDAFSEEITVKICFVSSEKGSTLKEKKYYLWEHIRPF